MKTEIISIITLTIISTMAISCNNSNEGKTSQPTEPKAIRTENFDTTVSAKNDFYNYATGGWQKLNPIKPEDSRYGSFDKLRESNKEQVNTILESIVKNKNTYKEGTEGYKIATLYTIAQDSVKLNKEGYTPIKKDLESIDALKSKEELPALLAQMHSKWYNAFFNIYVDADMKESTKNILYINQGGLGMDERDYYLNNDETTVKIREAYKNYIAKLFTMAGNDATTGAKYSETVLAIETEIAKSSYTKEKLREPSKNYNKIEAKDINTYAKGINLDKYLNEMFIGLTVPTELCISQKEPLAKVGEMIAKLSLEDIKTYLKFTVINNGAGYLSDEFVNASFEFFGKTMSGKLENTPRWKRAVDVTNYALGEAVGKIYVEKHFPAESKTRMVKLVDYLKKALGNHIDKLEWMSDSTKAKAHNKLSTFIVKIGYPDKWKDYSALEIKDDSYFENVMRANVFYTKDALKDAGKEVDKMKWGMTPQTVNAYYSPLTNEICFPAAILQPPFFYANEDDAINFGAIGVVIGHEMTHGFDDQGRQFDAKGNLENWWEESDIKEFDKRTKVLVEQYDAIEVIEGVMANGKFTLGENIADQGGLEVSLTALKLAISDSKETLKDMKDGFTMLQRYYLSYASIWASNIRDEEIKRLTNIDEHSLGKWRVNAALKNIPLFYEAFDIKEGDGMFLAPEKRVIVW